MDNLMKKILENNLLESQKQNIAYQNIKNNNFDLVKRINELFTYLETWRTSIHKNTMMHYGGKEYAQFLFASLMSELEEFKKLVNEEGEK